MSEVNFSIDGKTVHAAPGTSLLFAALDAGVFIPHLCAIREQNPPSGGCRLCWVEIEGMAEPVPSCSQTVREAMVVRTRSPAVDRLVRAGFEMLMSVHRLDCKQCPANRRCALQDIARARKLPLKPKHLAKIEPDFPIDLSRAELALNPNHCVLCGQCIHVCRDLVKKDILAFAFRGLKTVISTFDAQPLAEQDCGTCTRCADVCPVGALYRPTK